MKTIVAALALLGICAAIAAGIWLGTHESADGAALAGQSAAPSQPATSSAQPSGLWAWGNAVAGKTEAGKPNPSLDVLLAQAMRASNTVVNGDDPRAQLRLLAKSDPVVMKQLMQRYDTESNSQTRQLIVSMLSSVDKPEVLSFSKQLAASSDFTQRKDGFTMLQNLSADAPEVRAIILQSLARDKSPEGLMMALAALRPPADSNTAGVPAAKDAAAVVAQLQELTRNADPTIRLQSLIQLAQWDKSDSSQAQWTQALADQSPQVRQAAVTAIAQSGTRSHTVKTALLGMANNQSESKDVRGNALQVLEGFPLSKEEAASLGQLRSQISGL